MLDLPVNVGHFRDGNTPYNKGTKGLSKPNRGSFKNGFKPPNTRPVGSERIDADGRVWIKQPGRHPVRNHTIWKEKRNVVWESLHGPIPENHLVFCIDCDQQNCEPDNLVLVSRSESMFLARYKYSDLPNVELRETLRIIAKLEFVRTIAEQQL